MRAVFVLFAAAVLLLALAGCADLQPTPNPTALVPTQAPAPTRNPEGDVAQGKLLFSTWRCVDCHGENAGGKIGPMLASTRLTLTQFTSAVRTTRPPKPSFSESELSSADVQDLYAFVKGLPLPSEIASGPTLAEGEILGMKLYTESGCDRCHGAFAQGGIAAALVDYPEDVSVYLQKMSSTTAEVPEHDLETLDVTLMRRLYNWLKSGASPDSGC